MKKLKQILSVAIVATMLFGMSMGSVNAAEARGPMCPNCSTSMVPIRKPSSTSKVQRPCSHGYKYGTDVWEETTITTIITCTRCGLTYPPTNSTSRSLIKCGGYN